MPCRMLCTSTSQQTGVSTMVVCNSPGRFGVVRGGVVADTLARLQFQVGAAECMAVPRAEVRERHLAAAVNHRVHAPHFGDAQRSR